MPQIPYSGVPEVAPQDPAIPRYSANTPIAAFGGDTAQALQGLGKSFEGAGNEIFARAQAMQDLANHSAASEAVSDYMEKAGQIHADFSALQGKDAVAGFGPMVDKLKQARLDMQQGLTNPMVQKMFETESLSTQGRTIFNMAGHSAAENKSYAIGAAAARVQASRNAALVDPTDEAGFQQHLDSTITNTQAQYQLKGADQDTIDDATHKAVSNLWYDRIANLARQQPFTAQKMLDKVTKDGTLEGEDAGKLTQIVQGATRTVGARNISMAQRNGTDISFGAKPVPISAAKDAIGTFESGNNYQRLGPDTAHGQALGKYQVMEEFLPDFLKQAGMPNMTKQEFLASPKAQDQLFETVFGKYMQDTGSFNDAASKWLTGKTMAEAGNVADRNGTTAAKYVAQTNAILAKNAPLSDLVARGRATAEAQSPNDPLLPDYAEQRIIADHNQARAVERQTEYDARNTIDDAIIKGNNGKPFANVDEMIHMSPEAQQAYSQLPAIKQLEVNRNVQSWANAANRQTQKAAADLLRGQAYGSPEEVEKFINTNIYQQPLSQSDMTKFNAIQRKLIKDRGGDVQVRQALKMVEPILSSENVDQKDKDLMSKFRGSYIDAIEDWHGQNPNKPLDEKTAKSLAVGILQKQTSPNFYFGKDYLFNLPLPHELETQIRKTNPNISDAELETYRQEFVRQQFNALQKSKAEPNG